MQYNHFICVTKCVICVPLLAPPVFSFCVVSQRKFSLKWEIDPTLFYFYIRLITTIVYSTVAPWSEPIQPSHTRCKPSRAGNRTILKKGTAQSEHEYNTGGGEEERKGKRGSSYRDLCRNRARNLNLRSKLIHTLIDPLIAPLAALGQEINFFISWFFFFKCSSLNKIWQISTGTKGERETGESLLIICQPDVVVVVKFKAGFTQHKINNFLCLSEEELVLLCKKKNQK